FYVLRPAHRGDLGAVGLRDLDGEASDAAGRAGDRDPLTRMQLRVIADALERHAPGDGNPSRLLEAKPLGLRRQPVPSRDGVLGERAKTGSEDRVPDGEA